MDTATLIYAYLLGAIFVVSFLGKIALKVLGKYDDTPKDIQLEELVTLPLFAIGYVGMFAYAHNYPIFTGLFWQLYFLILISQQIASFFMPKLRFVKAKLSTQKYLAFVFVSFIISLPMLCILYAYAFTSFPAARA